MNEESEFKALYEQYKHWKQSQQGQLDAYEFERSFDIFCQQMNQQLLEMATAGHASEAKKKSIQNSEKSV